jgi:hypothetical protein
MKSEYPKQYEIFSNNMSSKISSIQDSFNLLKNSMANLIQNLPDEEKDMFILKYSQMSDAFESMFNRYNKVKR